MFVNIHTHHKPRLATEVSVRNAYLYEPTNMTKPYFFSSGLHPWFAESMEVTTLLKKLENCCKNPRCIAIGEIGLDENYPNKMAQLKVFEAQVAFAQDLKMPRIIHHVKALAQMQKALQNFTEPIVLHGFTSHKQVWEQLNKHNKTYVSFGKQALFPSLKLMQSIQQIPTNRMFFETDQSDISIAQIYQQISFLRAEPMAQLQEIIENNFKEVFPKIQLP